MRPIPFYSQTMDFTCGAACALMVLGYFDSTFPLTRESEMDVWREGNLFPAMGMGRYGIAFVLLRRGLRVHTVSSTSQFEFVSRIRQRIGEGQFRTFSMLAEERKERALRMGLIETVGEFTAQDVRVIVKEGGIPVILTDAASLGDESAPHWVVVNEITADEVVIHNPLARGPCSIASSKFDKMAGFEGDRVLIAVTSCS